MKRTMCLLLALVMVLVMIPAPVQAAANPESGTEKSQNPFTDVKEGRFYYDAVLWAMDHGIANGTTDTTFEPNLPCTRAEAVTFLWRMANKPEPKKQDNPFKDVKSGRYYYKAVLWAVEKGITNGVTEDTFEPNAPCSRSQIVSFLWRYREQPEPEKQDNPFKDVKSGRFYYKAVLWAVENEITSGTSDTTFEPNADCTRGHIVTFLYRNRDDSGLDENELPMN